MLKDIYHNLQESSPVATIIISVAFMLFFGFLMTRVTKKLRLPNVTAYIVTGVLMGPYCLDLIPRGVVDGMDFMADIALAFIAFSTGQFFRFSALKKNGFKVIIITICEAFLASGIVFVLLFVVLRLDLVFSLGALVIVMIVTKTKFTWFLLLFPFVLAQLYVFCIGLGLFLAQANVFFKDTQFIYNAVTTAWTYLTPIFYPLEALSDNLIWGIKHFNPMYFYIGQFRDLVYYGRMPGHLIILAGCGAAVAMLGIGMWSFLKSKDQFILYI